MTTEPLGIVIGFVCFVIVLREVRQARKES